MSIFDKILSDNIIIVCFAYVIVINIITFIMYGTDKSKARSGKWRIPESTLLLLAALGGSAGALLGMNAFRHKTKKKQFSVGVPLIFVFHILLLAGFIYISCKNII
ncbi:MAG: DUF1294 domain-containing protein [Clostridia bacterium]|nr:DUF1294 domain-containing protein [Clostridia bacterium]